LNGRRVLLGVCGGIAAYKAAALASRLVQRGVELDVILTAEAQHFIGTATFAALARRRVWTSMWERTEEIPHIALVRQAEVFAIVPATAERDRETRARHRRRLAHQRRAGRAHSAGPCAGHEHGDARAPGHR